MNKALNPPTRVFGRPPGTLPPGLNSRSAAVLREIVESYVETGEPVGSRTLSRRLPMNLSPATIRNVMADMTDAGLLYAPHTSAGRLPTDQGLRLFVDGLLHFGELSEEDRGVHLRRPGRVWPQPGGNARRRQFPSVGSFGRRRPGPRPQESKGRSSTSNSCPSAPAVPSLCW